MTRSRILVLSAFAFSLGITTLDASAQTRSTSQGGKGKVKTSTTTTTTSSVVPSVPTDVTAADGGGGTARISWAASVDATGYELERSPAFSCIVLQLYGSTLSFWDGCGSGSFMYRVRAVSQGGKSEYSAWVPVVVSGSDGVRLSSDSTQSTAKGKGKTTSSAIPAVPTNFAAIDAGGGTARASWGESLNATGYELERNPKFPCGVVQLYGSTLSFWDGCGAGSFSYRVRAAGPSGKSAYTDWAPVLVSGSDGGRASSDSTTSTEQGGKGKGKNSTTTTTSATPPVPTDLAVIDAGGSTARSSWAASLGATGYELERNPAFPCGVVQLYGSTLSFWDGCGAGTFSYRVRAAGSSGKSEFSAWASVVVAE